MCREALFDGFHDPHVLPLNVPSFCFAQHQDQLTDCQRGQLVSQLLLPLHSPVCRSKFDRFFHCCSSVRQTLRHEKDHR